MSVIVTWWYRWIITMHLNLVLILEFSKRIMRRQWSGPCGTWCWPAAVGRRWVKTTLRAIANWTSPSSPHPPHLPQTMDARLLLLLFSFSFLSPSTKSCSLNSPLLSISLYLSLVDTHFSLIITNGNKWFFCSFFPISFSCWLLWIKFEYIGSIGCYLPVDN